MANLPPPKLSVKEATDFLISTVPTWELDTFTWKCLDGRVVSGLKCWKNAPATMRAFWEITKAFPRDTVMAVEYGPDGNKTGSLTYGQADDLIGRWSYWLHSVIGLQKGERVAIGARWGVGKKLLHGRQRWRETHGTFGLNRPFLFIGTFWSGLLFSLELLQLDGGWNWLPAKAGPCLSFSNLPLRALLLPSKASWPL